MTPEFSRRIDADTVSDAPRRIEIEADAEERRRLAGRFRLKAIDRLRATIILSRRAGIIHAEGEVDAAVTQSCVVTDEPLAVDVAAPFAVRFVPGSAAAGSDEEIELSADDCETLPLDGPGIDLGELAAESLALALDPYPRAPGADDALNRAGHAGDTGSGPFAGLKALKDRLDKGD